MREYSTKEVISLCQRFVICVKITEEQDQVCDGEEAKDTETKQEGNVSSHVLNFCTVCKKSFETRKLFMVHVYQSHRKNYKYECTALACRKKCAHKFQLTKHSKLCHSKLSFKCKFTPCEKLYKSEKALLLHVKKKHS